MLKYQRNKLVNVVRKDARTLAVHGMLDDDIYALELDVIFRLPDLTILDVQGRWNRYTTPECPRSTEFLFEAVGFRVGQEGFGERIKKEVGRRTCRHYANLLLECAAAAKEATLLIGWEDARRETPELTLEGFLEGRPPETAAPELVTGRAEVGGPPVFRPEMPPVSERPAEKTSPPGIILDLHVHTFPASPCSS
ncbi:MAG: hypothetical protein AB1896_16910, partial [Thermodesulfobacteriota bacterium]